MIGTIYKIITDANDGTDRFKVYIGSTTKTIEQRLQQHIVCYKRFCDGHKGCLSSFEIIKNDWYEVQVVETKIFNNIHDLRKLEGRYIKRYKADDQYIVVNTRVECQTIEQYRKTHVGKDALSRANKNYYQKNIEEQREKKRMWYHIKKALLNK